MLEAPKQKLFGMRTEQKHLPDWLLLLPFALLLTMARIVALLRVTTK